MISDNLEIALVIFVILFQMAVFYKIIGYKKMIDQKNIQLIQLYLDTKFICKGLIDSLRISDPSVFCKGLMGEIKDYYNLEDIIIIDSIKMVDGENNTVLRSEVIKFIQKNIKQISGDLNEHKLVKLSMSILEKKYVLYLSRLITTDEGNGLVACIEHAPSLLNTHERISLENCINLLKTRLIYE